MDERAISFGSFRLLPGQRLLLEGDQPVRLGSRALDILAVLAENAGRVVPKEELIARVWPGIFVEESNLKIQVSALRRALGDGQGGNRYIVTVPGRGYEFVVPVGLTAEPAAMPAPAVPQPGTHNLPLAMTRMIGREEVVAALVSRLSRQRLVTVVGPGGIGKTTVALAVAERMIADYEDGVWLVDLAPLTDPRLVPSAVATVLGLEVHTDNPLPGLIAGLRDKRTLLLLDTCEHVIDAAANLAEAILSGAPGVNILATSRELLGVTGERGYRLGPLSSPQPSSGLTAADAATFPAVQLFAERVTAVVEDFALNDVNAPLVSEICRRLDGLPLAIEFVAPRVEVLGIEGVAAHLDDSLPAFSARRRTALPRHRTIRAIVDWSYGLLSEDEQQFFQALGIFAGGFTVDAAAAVVLNAVKTRFDALDRLADLVAKSLVVVDVSGAQPRFRLLDTTRAYAIEKLDESAERDQIARRHAEYYRELLEIAATGAAPGILAAGFAAEIDNIRAALVWAFSDGGNPSIAIALASASAQLLLELSLLAECQKWTSKALALLSPEENGTRREMVLQVAFGISFRFTTGATEEVHSRLTRALELAEQFNDADYKLRILHVHCSYYAWRGDLRAALAIARQCEAFAASVTDPSAQPMADRMLGIVQFYLGDLTGARAHLERALDRFPSVPRRNDLKRFGADQRLVALSHKSEILWLQGLADQALQLARSSLDEARTLGHPLALCNALVSLTIISIRVGDIEKSASWIEELHDQAEKHALNAYNPCAVGLAGQLSSTRNDNATAVRLLRAAVDRSPRGSFTYYAFYTMFAADLALAEAKAGEVDRGLAVIDETLQRIERNEERWYLPETLRIKGEILLLQGAPGAAAAAEDHLGQALDWARQQGALSWELRAATSLARLLRDQGQPADAIACLQPICDRFTEGFGTADLITAKRLLDEFSEAGGI